jgi:hypothetical protein
MTTSILTDLKRRRESLQGKMSAAEAIVNGLREDIEHIDGVICAYGERPVPAARTKRVEASRAALGILRVAAEPMTLRALALAVIAATGGNGEDGRAVAVRMDKLRTVLNRQAKNGVVRKVAGPGQFVLWEVVQ